MTAERQGMVSASYFFVGSEADVGGVRPSYWHRFDGSVPNNDRVDAVLEWLEQLAHADDVYVILVSRSWHAHRSLRQGGRGGPVALPGCPVHRVGAVRPHFRG